MTCSRLCLTNNLCYSSYSIKIYMFLTLRTCKVMLKCFFYSALTNNVSIIIWRVFFLEFFKLIRTYNTCISHKCWVILTVVVSSYILAVDCYTHKCILILWYGSNTWFGYFTGNCKFLISCIRISCKVHSEIENLQ